MTAKSLMCADPDTLSPDDTVAHGIDIIMTHRYRALPVVDAQGRYLGVFGVHCLLGQILPKAVLMAYGLDTVPFVADTLADLRQRLKAVEHAPVQSCMNRDAKTVAPDTPLVETLLVLYHNRQSIPVVDPVTGRLEGMISYWDVGAKILDQGA